MAAGALSDGAGHVFVADQLLEEQIEEFKEVFDRFDADHDDHLTVQELGTLLTALGNSKTEDEIDRMVTDVGCPSQGQDTLIDFGSFLAIMAQKIKDTDTEEELIEAFKVFDRDGDGFISANELRHSMMNLGERLMDSEVDEMIHEGDIDGDGKINFDEFWKMMMAK
jgi:calmodulin